ncbi:MAG: UbiD family decarboxylase [Chloroflexi bacterium]|nr:UbiD family decarboxylase [Chloroflexota bacterium]
MKFDDLREFIAKAQELGEFEQINGAALDEIGGIYAINGEKQNAKLFLFDEIPGYPKGHRVATNVLSSKKRGRLAANIPLDLEGKDLEAFLSKRLEEKKPVPPEWVTSGPILENVVEGDDVDLYKFPAPLWHELDAGPYIGTSSACFELDPYEGWVNIGSYRSQVYDRNHTGLHTAHGHHGQVIRDHYFEQGLDCPTVLSLGQEPSLLVATAENENWGVSELDMCGFLRGAPVQVVKGKTGIPIPASSEMVLEGYIMHPDHEPMRNEGMFGEGGGHYANSVPAPVVRIDTIYYRNDPIICGEPPYKRVVGRGSYLPGNEVQLMKMIRDAGFHDVVGISNAGPFLVVGIHQMYAGHAKRVADFVMTGLRNRPPKYLVIVDEDVDIHDPKDVFWAITSRTDPQESVHIYRNNWASAVSPRFTPEQEEIPLEHGLTVGCVLIDACKPFAWKEQFNPVNDVSPAYRKRIMDKWGEYLTEEPQRGDGRGAAAVARGDTM